VLKRRDRPDIKPDDRLAVARTSLSVAVTGHRLHRLGPEGRERIVRRADEVLAAIEREVAAWLPSDEQASLRLVTAVADGADTIFGEAAVERGWLLDVVLPFRREDYGRDFPAGGARETYERLLDASRAVFELHDPAAPEEAREVAYERAGRIVLSQADILLAVWDRKPVRGRGGAAQIVAEAVLQGIPIIHLDPTSDDPPALLWDGLQEHDLGQQTIDTVPRGPFDAVGKLLAALLAPPADPAEAALLDWFESGARHRRAPAFAWSWLLAVTGVARPRLPFRRRPPPANPVERLCGEKSGGGFPSRLREAIAPRFSCADEVATHFARLFRSSYVSNFTLAALAVFLTLLGLALPGSAKPALTVLELSAIAIILLLTHAGRKGRWHTRWLDCRELAERLRCLAVSAQLGELGLRTVAGESVGWVDWYVRATARQLGLPSARVDPAYLACCRTALTGLVEDQLGYLAADARRMRLLEHRLHIVGTCFFAITALTCVVLLLFELAHELAPAQALGAWLYPLLTSSTIASAALPAFGAAIYGIRMQGEFAGGAERSEALHHHLWSLRLVMQDDALDFDTLRRRALRATDLLTTGLGSWLQTYHARPLTLPG
jgi:hypothetical protein